MKPDPELLHLFEVKGRNKSQYSEIFTYLKAESMSFTDNTASLVLLLPILPRWTNTLGELSSQSLINFIDHLFLLVCHTYSPSDLMSVSLKISFISSAKQGQTLKFLLTSLKKSISTFPIVKVTVTCDSQLIATGSAHLKFTHNRPWKAPKI